MGIAGVSGNSYTNPYETNVKTTLCEGDKFSIEEEKSNVEEPARGAGIVPEEYAGMSFFDLVNSNMGNRNQIPVVNQIVSAKNPEDDKIYVTYFTDNQITCQNGDGTTAWEMKLNNEEQSDKIKEFFEKYKPDRAEVKEYFSDIKLGGVSSKDFWLDILGKD